MALAVVVVAVDVDSVEALEAVSNPAKAEYNSLAISSVITCPEIEVWITFSNRKLMLAKVKLLPLSKEQRNG